MADTVGSFFGRLQKHRTSLEEGYFVWGRSEKLDDVKEFLASSTVALDCVYPDGESTCAGSDAGGSGSFSSESSTAPEITPEARSPLASSPSSASLLSTQTNPSDGSFPPKYEAVKHFIALVEYEKRLMLGSIPSHIHELLNEEIHSAFLCAIEEIKDELPVEIKKNEMPDLDRSTLSKEGQKSYDSYALLIKSDPVEEKSWKNILCFVLFASVACVTETVGAFGDVYELIAHLGLQGIGIKIAVAAAFALIYQTVLWVFDLHAVAEELEVSYIKAPAHLEMRCEQAKKMHFLQGLIACLSFHYRDDACMKSAVKEASELQEVFIDRANRYQVLQEPSGEKLRRQEIIRCAWIAVAAPVFAGAGFWEVYTTLHLSFMLPIIAAWPPGLALGLCIVGALASVGIFYALQQNEMTNAVYTFFGTSKKHKDKYAEHIAGAQESCSAKKQEAVLQDEITGLKSQMEGMGEQQELLVSQLTSSAKKQEAVLQDEITGLKSQMGEMGEQQELLVSQLIAENKKLRDELQRLEKGQGAANDSLPSIGGNSASLWGNSRRVVSFDKNSVFPAGEPNTLSVASR